MWPNGKIIDSKDLVETLSKLETFPDVIAADNIVWKHRHDTGRDIYFLSNQTTAARTENLSFRASAKNVSIWSPETGLIERASATNENGRSSLKIEFSPTGSVFVVFGGDPIDVMPIKPGTTAIEITSPWTLQFPDEKIENATLISWTENEKPDIKYFSGTATYVTEFEVSAGEIDKLTFLDLGKVEAMATVTLNGHTFPTLWKYPYQFDASKHLKSGKNTLSIAITNTWNNRLVGDKKLPKSQRQTSITKNSVKSNAPLQPAGLLGPVKLLR